MRMRTTKLAPLAKCLVLALPGARAAQGSAKGDAPTKEGGPVMSTELLKSLVGSWEGTGPSARTGGDASTQQLMGTRE